MKFVINNNVFNELDKYIDFTHKVCILTDENVSKYYLGYFQGYPNVYNFVISADEESKSIDTYQSIISFLLDNYFEKTDTIVALGGGVVGDLAGFVSSTYKRGLNLISFPTTLLAMVDSSIGGKNGINFNGIKNVIGSFYFPNKTIISLNVLDTLPKREYNAGMMEALKTGLIGSEALYELIKNNDNDNLYKNNKKIIKEAIKTKTSITKKDPFEKGIRKYLNLGHTIGHAIEELGLGLLHGECVALGMIPFVSKEYDIVSIIHKLIDFSNLKNKKIDCNKIIEIIKNDKKWINGKLHIVYLNKISDINYLFLTEEELKGKIEEIIYEISIW